MWGALLCVSLPRRLHRDSLLILILCVVYQQQIAAFVVPLLVIVGWITHHDLTLFFADFETIVLFVSVLLVNFLIQDGKSNYMEGLMLITLYLVVALACEYPSCSHERWGQGNRC